jgi:hypothetical protein
MADRIYGSGNATAALSPRMIFRGDSTKLWLLKDSTKLSESELGFDTLTRTYFCRRDLEDAFTPRVGDIDFEFKKMRYWTHTRERKGGTTHFTVTYNGYLKARARVVRSEWNEKLNEMSLTAIGGGATCTLIFVCGTVSSRYANPTRPSSSEPIVAAPDSYVKILGLRGSGGIQLEGSERLTVARLREVFGLKIEAVRTDFKRTLQGAVWMCDETVDTLPVQKAYAIQVS